MNKKYTLKSVGVDGWTGERAINVSNAYPRQVLSPEVFTYFTYLKVSNAKAFVNSKCKRSFNKRTGTSPLAVCWRISPNTDEDTCTVR